MDSGELVADKVVSEIVGAYLEGKTVLARTLLSQIEEVDTYQIISPDLIYVEHEGQIFGQITSRFSKLVSSSDASEYEIIQINFSGADQVYKSDLISIYKSDLSGNGYLKYSGGKIISESATGSVPTVIYRLDYDRSTSTWTTNGSNLKLGKIADGTQIAIFKTLTSPQGGVANTVMFQVVYVNYGSYGPGLGNNKLILHGVDFSGVPTKLTWEGSQSQPSGTLTFTAAAL